LSYDDTEDGEDHDEVSNISNEGCEDDGGLYQPTEPATCFSEKDPHQSYGKLDGSVGINVCSFTETIENEATKREKQIIADSLIDIVPSVRNVKYNESCTHSLQDNDFQSNCNQNEENTDVTDKTNTTNFMRYIDKQDTSVSQVCDRGLGQDTTGYASEGEVNELQDERRNTLDEKGNESVPVANTKKEDQFSLVMENRLQNMINVRRSQCLPCQKKFNKLTDLRRHVVVHVGWNRYRCTECKFKCFSKYDCVAHVTKMHLGKAEHNKAQTMVEYIATEISDSENALSKYEPTEEPYRSQNNENGQHTVQDTNIKINSKFSPALEDVEITVNDTNCNKICDWPLEEYDESGTIITGTSDAATGIEAVPNNIQSSMIKVKDVEEKLHECAVEGERAENAVMYIPVKQGPMITMADPNSCVTTVKVKSGNISAPVVNNSTAILQEEERRKCTKSSSVRLNRYVMNTEGLEHEESESLPSKKRLTTTEYEQNIRKAIAVGKRQ
jgi:predicted fused transcriptional regulator/phosphomethylpyrimidine kinase